MTEDKAFERVTNLIGEQAFSILKKSSVAVFGVGGVGGYVVEALVRSGVGKITVFDNDVIDFSNLNRQIVSTINNIGQDKVEAVKNRALSINENVEIICNKVFYLPENADNYPLNDYDYIVDAVDTISAKIEIISRAKQCNVPIISCMGTGGKISPERLKVADIEKTSVCPLARVIRRELKKRNIFNVKVVYSDQENYKNSQTLEKNGQSRKSIPPSMIFVPAAAGLLIAKEVVFDIIEKNCR